MDSKTQNKNEQGRLQGVDGLRGIAALWVVLYHLWWAVQRREVDDVPAYIQWIFNSGFIGVDIFFVISGFVISYTTLNSTVDKYYIPRFILKRSVRIDPAYWATIILAVTFIFLKSQLFSQHSEELPSALSVISHIFYLQDILGYQPISSVFWTLCLEFQFYLIFSVLFYFASRTKKIAHPPSSTLYFLIIILTVTLSPYLRFTDGVNWASNTLIPYLYEFIFGIITFQYLNNKISLSKLFAIAAISGAVILYLKTFIYALAPLATVCLIITSSKRSHIPILCSKPLQFLGKISYSLYLTHAIVGWSTISLLIFLLEKHQSNLVTILIFTAGLITSIVFSFLFYNVVEKPSLKYSKSIRLNSDKTTSPKPILNNEY